MMKSAYTHKLKAQP